LNFLIGCPETFNNRRNDPGTLSVGNDIQLRFPLLQSVVQSNYAQSGDVLGNRSHGQLLYNCHRMSKAHNRINPDVREAYYKLNNTSDHFSCSYLTGIFYQ
ncbi:MAG: hypothetical protein ACW98F_04660, partial [Candidatus Hodarchaeales archaeon]